MSQSPLKWIAVLSMLIDHAGAVLFPQVRWMRIVGRLAFPIFAFFISEGFFYTRNRLRYFLRVFLLGAACQAVYFIAMGDTYLNILLTFSLSILLMWLLDLAKRALAAGRSLHAAALSLAFAAAVIAVFLFTRRVSIDYGFFGIMTAVAPALFDDRPRRLAAFSAGLIVLASASGVVQSFSLLALPLLYLYNGKRGRGAPKYFFYIFYPAHLAALQLISWIVGP